MKVENGKLKRSSNPRHRPGNPFEKEQPTVQPILDALAVQPDDVIVEIGAGDGHFAIPIARQLKTLGGSGVIFACDFSETLARSLDEAAAHQKVDDRVRAICLTAPKTRVLPFGNEHVTRVLAVNALQYFVDSSRYLADIARILSPRGCLLLADWGPHRYPTDKKRPAIGLAPEEVLFTLADCVGLDAHLSMDFPDYSWSIRAVKSATAS